MLAVFSAHILPQWVSTIARAMDKLNVPPALLARADEVIE